jgi:hypothetical protein
MTYVLQIIEFANGEPCPHGGQYLKSYMDTRNGRGFADFTKNPREAMQFATAGEAFLFWKQQSKYKPLRQDGNPNRPLTCSTVEIKELDP